MQKLKNTYMDYFFINPNISNDEEKSDNKTKKSSKENKDKESMAIWLI